MSGRGESIISFDLNTLSLQPDREIERAYGQVVVGLEGTMAAILSSSAPPNERESNPEPSARIERAFAALARRLVRDAGVRKLVAAGGETSGTVVSALGIPAVEIAGILDPGVPSLRTIGGPPLALALKSGNFGSEDLLH